MQKRGLQDQISGLKKEVELLKEDLCKARSEVAELEASRYVLQCTRSANIIASNIQNPHMMKLIISLR